MIIRWESLHIILLSLCIAQCIPLSCMTNSGKMIPKPELYFLPKDQPMIFNRLKEFLDTAQTNIRIAMYTLTDQRLINELSQLAKEGINIEIVIDESTLEKVPNLINQLQNKNIKILIFLANDIQGIMHHKYVIIDKNAVWTGSANFSYTVLDPKKNYLNDENIIILQSSSIAADYIKNFKSVKDQIKNLYVERIATTPSFELPEWLKKITHKLWDTKDYAFQEIVKEYLREPSTTPTQKTRLEDFLESKPIPPPMRGRRQRSSDQDSDPSPSSSRRSYSRHTPKNQSTYSSNRRQKYSKDSPIWWDDTSFSDENVDLQGRSWDNAPFKDPDSDSYNADLEGQTNIEWVPWQSTSSDDDEGNSNTCFIDARNILEDSDSDF